MGKSVETSTIVAIVLTTIVWLSTAAAQDSVRFGMSGPFSGPNRAVGEDFQAGIEACIANANTTKGKRRFELITKDDAGKAEQAAKNAEGLIDDERVVAMLAQASTGSVLALQKPLGARNAALIGTGPGTTEFLLPENGNLFLVKATYKRETDTILNYLKTAQVNRVGIFVATDLFGKSSFRDVEPRLAALGIKPVAIVQHAPDAPEIKPESAKQMVEAKPDAIVFISGVSAATKLIADTTALGYLGDYYGMSIVATASLINSLKPGMHGRVRLTRVAPLPTMTTLPLVREFQQGMKTINKKPSPRSVEGFIACRVAVEAVSRINGKVTPSALLSVVRGLRIDLRGHEIDFTGGKREGSRAVDIIGLRKDGSFVY